MSINTQKIKQLILNHLNLVNLKPKIFSHRAETREEVEKKEKEFEERVQKEQEREKEKEKQKDDDHSGLDEV